MKGGGVGVNAQFEEGIGDLQHQHVRMVVFVTDQHTLARASHAMLLVVLFQSLQSVFH